MLPSEHFLAEHGRPKINYELIAKAIRFYTERGYEYIEVPWIVPELYNKITFSGPLTFTIPKYGALVGSAEQSFLFMALNGLVKPDHLYVAASPCFRDDDVDLIHQKSFFKVELFCAGKRDCVDRMIANAQDFFQSIGLSTDIISVENDQRDLVCENIELGSYGKRQHGDLAWSYGTGLAEPRASFLINKG